MSIEMKRVLGEYNTIATIKLRFLRIKAVWNYLETVVLWLKYDKAENQLKKAMRTCDTVRFFGAKLIH